MSKYAIEDSTLTSIAEAIRSKAGTTEALKPVDMPEAIAAIQAGGGSGSGLGTDNYNHYIINPAPNTSYSEYAWINYKDYITDVSDIAMLVLQRNSTIYIYIDGMGQVVTGSSPKIYYLVCIWNSSYGMYTVSEFNTENCYFEFANKGMIIYHNGTKLTLNSSYGDFVYLVTKKGEQ